MALAILPDILSFVETALARTYAPGECWRLVVDLLVVGGLVPPKTDVAGVLAQTEEVWWYSDPVALHDVVAPWDILFMARKGWPQDGAPVGHCGVVVSPVQLVHVRQTGGVCVEPLQRWQRKVLQVGRLFPRDEAPWQP